VRAPFRLVVPAPPATGAPATVLIGAHAVEEDDLPANARKMLRAALAAGWEAIATYAAGRTTRTARRPLQAAEDSKDQRKYELVPEPCAIESWAVRVLNPSIEYRVAVWERYCDLADMTPFASAKFASAWQLSANGLLRMASAQIAVFPKTRHLKLIPKLTPPYMHPPLLDTPLYGTPPYAYPPK
jgi:hypothetical protein